MRVNVISHMPFITSSIDRVTDLFLKWSSTDSTTQLWSLTNINDSPGDDSSYAFCERNTGIGHISPKQSIFFNRIASFQPVVSTIIT